MSNGIDFNLNKDETKEDRANSDVLSRVFDGQTDPKKSFGMQAFKSMAKSAGIKLGLSGILLGGAALAIGGFYAAKHTSTFMTTNETFRTNSSLVSQSELKSFKELSVDKLQPIKEVMEPEFNQVLTKSKGKVTYKDMQHLEDKLIEVTKKLYGTPVADERSELLSEKNKNKPK